MGSHENLGAWDPSKGVQMTWTEGDVWQARVAFNSRSQRASLCLLRPLGTSAHLASLGSLALPPSKQASVALPRNEEVEFKIVRRLKSGAYVFSEASRGAVF